MCFIINVLQMRMSVLLETLVLMPVTTPWALTIVPAPEASQSQLMAGPVRVHNTHTHTHTILKMKWRDYHRNRLLSNYSTALHS